MSEQYLSKYTTNPVMPSLLTLSSHAVAHKAGDHVSTLHILPKSLKDRLLSLLSKRGGLTSVTFTALLHNDVHEIDLSESVVCDTWLDALRVCKSLSKLDLNPGRGQKMMFTSSGLASVFPHLHYLRILHVRYSSVVNDEVICSLAVHSPFIEELDIGGCENVGDDSLRALGEHVKQLKCVNLSGANISDSGILSFLSGSASCNETLCEFRLTGCKKITNFSIECICEMCKQLKLFNFHSCPLVTDESRLTVDNMLSNRLQQIFFTVY